MLAGKPTEAHERESHGNAGALSKGAEAGRGARCNDAAATINDWFLTLPDCPEHGLQFVGRGPAIRPIAGQVHGWIIIGDNAAVLDVLRHVHNHRTWTTGTGNMK